VMSAALNKRDYTSQGGLGLIQYENGEVPFSYFYVGKVRIVVVDDVLKYYKDSGGHSEGSTTTSDGYCGKTIVCLHGQSDRAGTYYEGGVTFDTPAVKFNIEVYPSNATFSMVLNGKTFSSKNGNVFLVTTLNQYSVQQITVDFSKVEADAEVVAEKLRELDAVYEFAQTAIAANQNWDNWNDYSNRF
jgi:hypothetical protein